MLTVFQTFAANVRKNGRLCLYFDRITVILDFIHPDALRSGTMQANGTRGRGTRENKLMDGFTERRTAPLNIINIPPTALRDKKTYLCALYT